MFVKVDPLMVWNGKFGDLTQDGVPSSLYNVLHECVLVFDSIKRDARFILEGLEGIGQVVFAKELGNEANGAF